LDLLGHHPEQIGDSLAKPALPAKVISEVPLPDGVDQGDGQSRSAQRENVHGKPFTGATKVPPDRQEFSEGVVASPQEEDRFKK
jgi:hypothetical protein